jgi:hypothetical protein
MPDPDMSDSDNPKSRISRRVFGRQAVVAAASAATAAALPAQLLGESLAPSAAASAMDPAATLAAQVAAPAAQTKLSPATQAEADATFQAILRLHGDHLTDDQKKDIRRLVIEGQKPLELLRAFPLDNSDQPGNVLKLYPDVDAAPDRAASPASAHTSRHSLRATPAAPTPKE